MKIVSETRQRLHVRNVPWFLRGIFIILGVTCVPGAIFSDEIETLAMRLFILALALGMVWLGWWITPTLDLVFDRSAGTATMRQTRIGGVKETVLPLSGLRAGQQSERSSETDGPMFRLVLHSQGEIVPLEKGYGPNRQDAIEAEINRWLDGRPAPPDPAVARA